ncbi:IS66 family insertion sequence element accessory protein TnpB [Bradyrhizobium elkanii]|uniref:IS66 family insertion sequence element accessory protein TnpB n=1 Tax=Bradyrhizobium elkanii TaxID=29448 RepID=UPI0012F6E018|nr:IS66 family insertion sequence element accessory protein TnpB [Bradyrhizobium elkanii]
MNANLLRKWVAKRQRQNGDGSPGGADCASLCSGSRAVAVAKLDLLARSRFARRGAILCRAADGIDAQRRDAFAGRRRRALAVCCRGDLKRWGVAMFRLASDLRVYLHREPIDFRAGINSLAIVVEQSMGLDPFQRAVVFAFCNRRRDPDQAADL